MKAEWFGARLKELREQSGMTQQELAEVAHLTREGIAQIETNRRKEPGWRTVLALCQALGVSCEEFAREPTDRRPATRGRPRKATKEEGTKRKKGSHAGRVG